VIQCISKLERRVKEAIKNILIGKYLMEKLEDLKLPVEEKPLTEEYDHKKCQI
jgi:hypothetical protein